MKKIFLFALLSGFVAACGHGAVSAQTADHPPFIALDAADVPAESSSTSTLNIWFLPDREGSRRGTRYVTDYVVKFEDETAKMAVRDSGWVFEKDQIVGPLMMQFGQVGRGLLPMNGVESIRIKAWPVGRSNSWSILVVAEDAKGWRAIHVFEENTYACELRR